MQQIFIKDAVENGAIARAFRDANDEKTAQKPSEEIARILIDPKTPIAAKSRAVYVSTGKIMNELFESGATPEKIQETKNSINALLGGVFENQITTSSLIKVSNYDYYTYTHCVNVAVYSIGLGREVGLTPKELERLGAGAILHDLGKSRVDLDIVNKPGRLTEEEFVAMKSHPDHGYDILREQFESDEIILTSVRHHHEKMNGSGYPDGVKGANLSLYARIVAVCDVFDALSTKRSYKPALSSFDALNLMKTRMSEELDPKLLQIFIKMMGKNG